ncbi:MAG: pilin N-terminal domain-containing protein, partial [Anaerovoracaceae bacterium]
MKKQRLSKKFGAIMVALTLVAGTFGMSGLFANAAVIGGGGGDGNQQPQRGNITIHKYAMEDITEATWQGTGSSTDIRNVPASATPLGNIGFKVYAVSPVSGAYPADRNFTLNKDEAGVVTGILSEGITYTVAQVGNDLITNKEGIAVTETLPKGVYLVEEQDSVDPESGKSINVVKVA